MAKTFVCGKCQKTFKKIHNLQPVKVINQWNPMCQYCWSEINWGKAWADKCLASQPDMQPIPERLVIQ